MNKFIGRLSVHQFSFSVWSFTTFAFAMLPDAANLDKMASNIKHRGRERKGGFLDSTKIDN